MTVRNAKITSTFLGIEDHGIMTFMIYLDGGSFGIGYGGYALDEHQENKRARRANQGYQAIRHILEILKVDSWEKLPNMLCRIDFDDGPGLSGRITRIGHIMEDAWFDLAAYMKEAQP